MSKKDNNPMSEAVELFFMESREMLGGMESNILTLEKDPSDQESINSLFRVMHTIKGSSGMFNFSDIEVFSHVVENVLDLLRKNHLVFNDDLAEVLFQCHDYINVLLDIFENDHDALLDDETASTGLEITKRLDHIINRNDISEETDHDEKKINDSKDINLVDDTRVESKYWHISLRFRENVFRDGLDPQSFITYLNDVGSIVNILTVDSDVPSLQKLEPESCYLGFEIVFDGNMSKKELLDVFNFIQDDCEIRILPPGSSISEYITLINELPDSPMKIGDILVKVGSLTEKELQKALMLQETLTKTAQDTSESHSLIGEIMVNEKMIHEHVVSAALEKQKDIYRKEEKKNRSLRIDAEKLDELINIVGELVITGSNVRQLVGRYGDSTVSQSMETMSRLIENVRDRIMNVRMVQIGETFKRFERIVRDLGRESGKEIHLDIMGGETEMDKTLVEKITDPLMHIIRNSVDHGIDTPEERIRKGKDHQGKITINAYYETGSVVIEIKDDGNGLNREKIHKKAAERGIITAGQDMNEQELFQLVFEPGFSTADKVTNISGRGVGMDVVRRNIEALRGTVVLESEENIGTTVRIHLPLTLAIIDGFMVMVAGSYYIIPLDLMREVFEIQHEELESKEGINIINLRGEVLPFMRLRDFFGETDNDVMTECVVVVEYSRTKAGFVVDRPLGEFQTVIKSMGPLFKEVNWASGATILGSGEVALILDVPRLIEYGGINTILAKTQ